MKSERDVQVLSLYDGGATLAQIGRALGVTRERARQLVDELACAGVIVKRSREERLHEATFPARADEVEGLFLALRDDCAVADRTGIDKALVRRFIDEHVPDADVLRHKPKTRNERYSDEELVHCLKTAAGELPTPMGYEAYTAFSRGRMLDQQRPWPGPQGMILRFGCWRSALTRAGLPTHPSAGPDARFELADAVDAIARAWRDSGRPPTICEYDAWRAGRAAFPASATMRKLVDGWDCLHLAAWPIVHRRPVPGVSNPDATDQQR